MYLDSEGLKTLWERIKEYVRSKVPTRTSQLQNDSGYISYSSVVNSFNGQTGDVNYEAPVSSVNGQTGAITITIPEQPTRTSQLQNDSGFISEHQSLSGYATQSWVNSQNYLKAGQTISGYATESWVMSQGFLMTHQDISGKLDKTARAKSTAAIPFAQVSGSSTSTKFIATIPGITAYEDGLCVMLKNGVVTSASSFTININGLGAKKVYTNMAAATVESTIFNINYTMLFVYDSTRSTDGGWVCYRGYDSNTNTIGYQLRTNSSVMKVSDTARYYKLYFTSADGKKWVPASANSTNNATSARAVNQRPINPWGPIVYTSASTSYTADSNLAATTIWQQYVITLGYSFNRTGAALTLTKNTPVYVKCAPQTDGSAIMDATTPIVQALPTTADGKIYIFLGIATAATTIELWSTHPVYHYKDGAIRLWSNATTGGGSITIDSTPTEDSTNAVSSGGVYDALDDMATQTWVGNQGYLTSHQDISGKADKSEMAVSTSGDTTTITLKSGTSATVISSHQSLSSKQDVIDSSHKLSADLITDGSTNKVINVKPDWNAASGNAAEILNKPTIPTVPTNVSAFNNDAGYLTSHQSLSGYATETWVGNQGYLTSHQDISGKEDTTNKVTSLSNSSTDTQYPSAKCVYDILGDIQTALTAILS